MWAKRRMHSVSKLFFSLRGIGSYQLTNGIGRKKERRNVRCRWRRGRITSAFCSAVYMQFSLELEGRNARKRGRGIRLSTYYLPTLPCSSPTFFLPPERVRTPSGPMLQKHRCCICTIIRFSSSFPRMGEREAVGRRKCKGLPKKKQSSPRCSPRPSTHSLDACRCSCSCMCRWPSVHPVVPQTPKRDTSNGPFN